MIVSPSLLPIALCLASLATTALAAPARVARRDEGSLASPSAEPSTRQPASALLLAPSDFTANPTPTSSPSSDDPTSPPSVPGTLVFSNPFILALPSALASAAAAESSPSATPVQAAQSSSSEQNEFPPTTHDGLIASSLVGVIVALGLLGTVWCLVRARVQRRRMRRERTVEEEKDRKRVVEEAWETEGESKFVIGGESESGSDGSRLGSIEVEGEDEGEKEELDEGLSTNVARLSKHQDQESSVIIVETPSTSTIHPAPAPLTDETTEADKRERLRTATSGTSASIDSYYTSPAVSPAPAMDSTWGATASPSPARPGTTESVRGTEMGRAI